MSDAFSANAASMPDRRAALSALVAAGALLAAPRVAKAANPDADVFAAIEHVRALLCAQDAACERLNVLNRLLPKQEDIPALRAQKSDPATFKTNKAAGEALGHEDVKAAQSLARAFRSCGIGENNAMFGAAYARLMEIDDAWFEFKRLWTEARDRLNYDEVEEAWDDAVTATDNAAKALFDLRPNTVAGLRAIMVALKDVNFYENSEDGEDLQRFLLDAPALAVQA